MLPDIQPGNTKILYFFNCLLDGMHTMIILICDFSRGGLNTRLYTLVSKPCSEATNKDYFIPRELCFGYLCKLRIYFEKDLREIYLQEFICFAASQIRIFLNKYIYK